MALEATKQDFYDAHERRAYERAVELANSLLQRPDLLAAGARFLERFIRPDAQQAHVYRVWTALLRCPSGEVASALVEDSDYGRFLRETAPPFLAMTDEDIAATRRLFP